MNDLLRMCGLGNVYGLDTPGAAAQRAWAEKQMRDMRPMPQYGRFQPVETNLEACLRYFRREGLTDEQIRKAIAPALFAALREIKR